MAKRKPRISVNKPPVVVRKMELGRGVYAKRNIDEGFMMGPIEGEVYDDPDFGSDYCMDMGESLSLEPRRPFRFLNHSCDPNCSLVLLDDPAAPHGRVIMLESLCEIASGEELTIDYSWPIDSAIPCRCQSPKCRGWIVDPGELPKLKRRERAKSKATTT